MVDVAALEEDESNVDDGVHGEVRLSSLNPGRAVVDRHQSDEAERGAVDRGFQTFTVAVAKNAELHVPAYRSPTLIPLIR